MRILKITFLSIIILSLFQCVRVPGEGGGDGVDPNISPWTKVDELVSDHELLNSISDADVMRIVSNSEFLVLDKDRKILEKVPFTRNAKNFGTPAMSKNVFARIGGSGTGDQVLEFRLVKNPLETWPFTTEELAGQNEVIIFDEESIAEIGAFNPDGNDFLLPVIRVNSLSGRKDRVFIRFNIELEGSTFRFLNITTDQFIEIDDISSDEGAVSSIFQVGTSFLIASQNGAYRIDRNGRVSRFSFDWTRDFFRSGGDLYATVEGGQMHVSEDNGLNWDRSNIPSDLQLVRVSGAELISQKNRGGLFDTPIDDENPFETSLMKVNPELEGTVGNNHVFEFFNGDYYFSVGKELYFAPEIKAVE